MDQRSQVIISRLEEEDRTHLEVNLLTKDSNKEVIPIRDRMNRRKKRNIRHKEEQSIPTTKRLMVLNIFSTVEIRKMISMTIKTYMNECKVEMQE